MKSPVAVLRLPPDILPTDARHVQIFCQSLFLLVGIGWLGWQVHAFHFALTFAACLFFQHAIEKRFVAKPGSWKSATISALSLCLMMKANAWWAVVLCALFTIGSKFFIRYKGRHVFNPTNFGIMVTLLLTGEVWVSPGRWGSALFFLILLGALSAAVLFRVGRMETALSFLGTFAALHFARSILYQGWPADYFIHQLSSGTLLLFTFFMITDPMTTPVHPKARIIWAALTGTLAFYLSTIYYVHTAPLWALLVMSPFTLLFNHFFRHERFQWR
ncbi:MAG: RnfABCDGE type electron transport complex subunit D [Flavobacteriales bacterium]|nr:RnfABCDGE type electron transport complex subunit D [Flavobacteriales bacterium]MCB9449588.1 RnfABCDGE type electron transport complex subunit D [Flavobacteriales bacterium]